MGLPPRAFETRAYASFATSAGKLVELEGIEPSNLLSATQALSQLSYSPKGLKPEGV